MSTRAAGALRQARRLLRPGTNEIHVRARTKFGHTLHEAMHKVAHPVFFRYWQRFINEGVTQYFTDLVLREQGLPRRPTTSTRTSSRARGSWSWRPARTWVARAYFLNDQALREALRKRLKLEPIPAATEIGAERICTRL